LTHFSGCLARSLAYVTGGLSGAFTDIFHRRLGTGAHVLHGRACALYSFTRARTNVFHGFTRALNGFTGT
jgi:hypothetical protein